MLKQKQLLLVFLVLILALVSVGSLAAADVAGTIEETWLMARGQIQDVVNRVVFPIIDTILTVLLFVKIATMYLEYRKHGHLEWTGAAILLVTLVFSLTAPLYIWNIIA